MSMNGATHRPNRDEVKHPITHTITSPNFEVISRLNLTDSAHDSYRLLRYHDFVKILLEVTENTNEDYGFLAVTTKLVFHTDDLFFAV